MRPRLAVLALTASVAVGAVGCSTSTEQDAPVEDPVGFDQPDVAVEDQEAVSPAPTPSPSPTAAPSPSPEPSPSPPSSRAASTRENHPVVLVWEGLELRAASALTEMVGLHQSNHDGARNLDATDTSDIPVVVMETRERSTGLRSAADIVVHPDTELLAPVSGTVKRAGTYTLYCDNLDDFLVIEPDDRPGIEVKLLHIDGVQVSAGDRVEAGVTVVAPRPTPLPFDSQVDELSGPDDWPHVHMEVVDTSIPDQPNPNSGSDDC